MIDLGRGIYGSGATPCGFCDGRVVFNAHGWHVTIVGRVGAYAMVLPLFCSDECFRASEMRLDERVNQCVV